MVMYRWVLAVMAVAVTSSSYTRAAEKPADASAINADQAAASFNCSHAASTREHLVCSDPVLSALDSRLGRIYREKQALLTEDGIKLLQRSERSWLEYVNVVCTSDTAAASSGSDSVECLNVNTK